MPKRVTYLLTLAAGLLACYGFLAAKAPLAAKQYDYVTLTQTGETLRISSTPDHFETQRTKLDKSGYEGNYSLLFSKVNEYEAQGYELFENNALAVGSGGLYSNYVLLRRPKQ
ncbi:MAG: hypothetical protein ACRYFK_16570 [Janthinobacterium lividum]